MNKGFKKILGLLVVALSFGLAAAPPVYAAEKTSPAYPNRPNVVWDVSERKTVIVHLINATNFPMQVDGSDFKDYVDNDHQVQLYGDQGPVAFSPSGIPQQIPAKRSAAFVVSWLDTQKNGNNTGDVMPDVALQYAMKGVTSNYNKSSCPNGVTTGDVLLHLNFNRVKHTKDGLAGDIFKLMVSSTALVVDSVEMALEPNPISLAGVLISATEIAEDSAEIHQKNSDSDSDQLYFSAYVVAANGNLDQNPEIHRTADMGTSESAKEAAQYDGLYSIQDPTAGCPQAYIVPVVALEREMAASKGSLSGHLPAVVVALVTEPDIIAAMNSQTKVTVQASSAGYRMTQHLQREGHKGQVAFIKLARSLSSNDRALLDGAYKEIHAKKTLSREQEEFLLKFAIALEKHETKLEPNHSIKTQPHNAGRK